MTENTLDRVTQSLVDQFVAAEQLTNLSASDRFERFANFAVVSSEYSETFDVEDVSSVGTEVGIDGIAVIVNGALVTDVAQVHELAERNGFVEATFVFVSAKRSPKFSEAEIGNLTMAVEDFFRGGELPRTLFLDQYHEIKDAIYGHGVRFKHGLPHLRVYYVTMGRWEDQDVPVRRLELDRKRLEAINEFETVAISPVGAKQLRELYFRTQNPIEKAFTLNKKVTLLPIPGVSQAYLGIIPAKEYVDLIADEAGQIRKSLFTDNVRDFRGEENDVNAEIAETLRSPNKDRFPILNNGVTIVARTLTVTGDKFYIKDFQIVNGGQTSHVLFNEKGALDESVWVPIRVVATDDEDLTTAVITATNNQTPVLAHELNARSEFERDLERYFSSFDGSKALYYERRSRQYSHVTEIEKVRIIPRDVLVRAFAATFLDEPHRATGYVPLLMDQLGVRIMHADHKLEPYYAAAFAHYKLEFFWRNKQLDSTYKPGRWQILMAARHLAVGGNSGPPNSKQVAQAASEFCETLWADNAALKLFKRAIGQVNEAVGATWARDHMRNQPTTQDIRKQLRS